MRVRRELIILAAIFIAVLALRLFIAFGSRGFNYDAYFDIARVEDIRENLLFDDTLSFSIHPFMPLFHYIVAFFSKIISVDIVLKVLPNVFASFTVIGAYLVSLELTKEKNAALFSAFSAGFVPVFFFGTVNSVASISLVVPLMFFLVYFFLRLREDNFLVFFFWGLFSLVMSSQLSLIFPLGLSVYALLMYILGTKVSRAELEIAFFSLIFSLWVVFLFFKEPLQLYGLSALIAEPLVGLNVLEVIYKIGILTFIAGIFVIYRNVFEERSRNIHVPIGLSIAVLTLMIFGMVSLDIGLIFLGVIFSLFAGVLFKSFFEYLKKTHAAGHSVLVLAVLIGIFLFTSVLTSASFGSTSYNDGPSRGEIAAFEWLGDEEGSHVVFSDLKEGNLVTAISRKKNFLDDHFFMSPDVKQRIMDMETLYTTPSQVEATEILDRYDISHLVVTRKALESRNLTGLAYVNNNCFEPVYENSDAIIYSSLCRVSG